MQIIGRVARYGNAAPFRLMLKLSMTSYRRYQIPTIVCEELEDVANFH